MDKEWIGNSKSAWAVLGASSHSEGEREVDDFYATDPEAVLPLLEKEIFSSKIWECAVGKGHIANELIERGYKVYGSDIVDRGFPDTEIIDFLDWKPEGGRNYLDIITNPPYKYAKEFVEHALDNSMESVKIAMFLKIQFLEGQARRELFEKYPPKNVYVFTKRVKCAKNGEFDKVGSSAVCYAWFVWEKGWWGKPTIDWI